MSGGATMSYLYTRYSTTTQSIPPSKISPWFGRTKSCKVLGRQVCICTMHTAKSHTDESMTWNGNLFPRSEQLGDWQNTISEPSNTSSIQIISKMGISCAFRRCGALMGLLPATRGYTKK
ncbi:hypothetical protein QCA50_001765 [Cerrena zonata]|uniref:Uncharacterized protein n=1 Tax=Cerrena zonata TaxID=2478898 RepID=A0AAW0GU43_9APHY